MIRKVSLAVAVFVSLALTAAAFYFIFIFNLNENQYNRLISYYIARKLTCGVTDFDDKVAILRNFVHENVHPVDGYDTKLNTVAVMHLISGVGWCDGQSKVFIYLASRIGITSRLVYLRDNSGSSPHTIAQALSPDNRWVLVDSAFNLDLFNQQGKTASEDDIKSKHEIIINNERIKSRFKYAPKTVGPNFTSIYYNKPTYRLTVEGKKYPLLDLIPLACLRPVFNIMQCRFLSQFKDGFEYQILLARGYHLLGYYRKSMKIYDRIIKVSGNKPLVNKAEFFRALLLKDMKKYREADEYIQQVIKENPQSPYIPYLIGLRAVVLRNLGKEAQADDLLKSQGYSLYL